MERLKNHKHIVVSGDTGNALGVVRALGEGGIKPILIYLVEKTHLPTLIRSKYLSIVHNVYSHNEALQLLIQEYGNEALMPFVYTCDDSAQSCVDNLYDNLVGKFYFFNAGEQGRINQMMDKHEICLIAESCGCNIPKQEVVDTGVMPQGLKYPVMTKTLKSIMGLWKADSYICHSPKELQDAYKKIKSPQLVIEEFIDKKNELSLMGFSCNQGKEIYIPYKLQYLRASKSAYGHYMYLEPLLDETIKQIATNIIRKCKFSGCFEIEFLVDQNDELWFLEVNFRYSFWNYALTYGGVNYPLEWAKAMLDNKITTDYKLKEYFTLLNEPGDFGQSVASKKITIWQWMKDIHNADMLYFYHPNDPLPAWSFWWNKLLRMVKNKILKIYTKIR